LAYLDDFSRYAFLNAVASLPERKNNDGKGRAANAVAQKFGVCVSTVYQARKVLKIGRMKIVNALRKGDIQIKTAYKLLIKENAMNINGFEELSYLKNYDSLLTEIKNIEKIINEAGSSSEVNPRFSIDNNKISFDIRVSLPFPQAKSDGKPSK